MEARTYRLEWEERLLALETVCARCNAAERAGKGKTTSSSRRTSGTGCGRGNIHVFWTHPGQLLLRVLCNSKGSASLTLLTSHSIPHFHLLMCRCDASGFFRKSLSGRNQASNREAPFMRGGAPSAHGTLNSLLGRGAKGNRARRVSAVRRLLPTPSSVERQPFFGKQRDEEMCQAEFFASPGSPTGVGNSSLPGKRNSDL